VTPQRLGGTEGAALPFWSPDSRSVGFFADSRLKRIDLDGGAITVLAPAPSGSGGSWSAGETIAFSPIFTGPLFQVSAAGGDVRPLTTLVDGQINHRLPHFLPDGRHLLYYATGSPSSGGVYVADSDNPRGRRLIDAEAAAFHRPSGRLLFIRQDALFAQPFDPASQRLNGVATTVARPVEAFSTSDAGPIAYRGRTSRGRRQFVWLDRSGRELGRVGEADANIRDGDPALSPDGTQLAVNRLVDGDIDIWLLELTRGVLSRFTSEPSANTAPRWSPDGKAVVFGSNRTGIFDLYTKGLADREDRLLLSTAQNKSVTDWSSDGRFILFRSVDPVTSHDLWALPLEGSRTPFPVARTPFVDAYGQFSHDGKWVAFQSDESGRPEVYVQAFPTPGARIRVSTDGGAQMRWRRDGRELYYIALDGRMMAVSIQTRHAALVAGEPTPLFRTRVGDVVPAESGYYQSYVITPDGSRFLISTAVEETRAAPITVIQNWRPN
jgi:Tol biopolymer transport system component